MQKLFPAKPSVHNHSIATPGTTFKKEVARVFFLCLLFLLLYLVLLIAVVGIAVLAGFFGVYLVYKVHHFAFLMIAAGAIGMGIMLIYFMAKALVLKKAELVATVGEITPDSEPLFYDFIRKVCEETRAPFPRRIFLVDEVNAFVSYDSMFLSLFFPVRKNLYIGLGLINSLTVSELKAVIAHEFGHFSQGSMRFGSYIYHFNQIIYKMVVDNSGYNAGLEKFASVNNYFALFATINMKLIRGIQDLMAEFFKVLNKGYKGLSRQMEFHADAVAASTAGSAPLINSLYRLELAGACYEHLLNYYNGLIKDNFRADNLYLHHFKLMQLLAEREHAELKNGFPMISATTIDQLGRSRVVIKDQWASHPSVEDREAALLNLNIAVETIDEPAWMLFSDGERAQITHTDRIYQGVNFSSEPVLLNAEDFDLKYRDFLQLNSFHPAYRGYYDNRNIQRFDVSPGNYTPEDLPIGKLFSGEYVRIPKSIARTETDIAILESISAKGAGYKSFDFDGVRYPVEDVASIQSFLNKELRQLQDSLLKHDQEIFYIARRKALQKGINKDLENAFIKMFDQIDLTERDILLYRELMDEVAPAYTKLLPDEIKVLVLQIIHKEKELKKRIEEILNDQNIVQVDSFLNEIKLLRQLHQSSHVFFTAGEYLNDQLYLLNEASNAFLDISTRYCFLLKKEALEIQMNLLKPEEVKVEG